MPFLIIMETAIKNKTMYELIFKQRNVFLDIGMILVSVVLLGIMANIRIPLWPVPITMQTFGVFAIAFFFGSRKGALSILAYVLAGALGFGVFAGYSSGMAEIMGPSGGYILGFLFMAFFVGLAIEKGHGRTRKSMWAVMLIGEAILYLFGLAVLWLNFPTWSLWQVLMAGLIPFIIGDVLKIAGAAVLFPYLWKGSEKISS